MLARQKLQFPFFRHLMAPHVLCSSPRIIFLQVFGCYITNDGKRVISAEQSGNIMVWDIESGDVTKSIKTRFRNVCNTNTVNVIFASLQTPVKINFRNRAELYPCFGGKGTEFSQSSTLNIQYYLVFWASRRIWFMFGDEKGQLRSNINFELIFHRSSGKILPNFCLPKKH